MLTEIYKRAIIQIVSQINNVDILKKIYTFVKTYLE